MAGNLSETGLSQERTDAIAEAPRFLGSIGSSCCGGALKWKEIVQQREIDQHLALEIAIMEHNVDLTGLCSRKWWKRQEIRDIQRGSAPLFDVRVQMKDYAVFLP